MYHTAQNGRLLEVVEPPRLFATFGGVRGCRVDQRTLMGAVLLLVIGAACFLGGWYWFALIAALCLAGLWEFYRVFGIQDKPVGFAGFLGAAAYLAVLALEKTELILPASKILAKSLSEEFTEKKRILSGAFALSPSLFLSATKTLCAVLKYESASAGKTRVFPVKRIVFINIVLLNKNI